MRPSEIITSLRHDAEVSRKAIKVAANARFCLAGHVFQRVLVVERQTRLADAQQLSELPPIACDGCDQDIIPDEDEYIAGCCKVCDIDFCEACFASGKPIDEMLQERLENELETSTLGAHTASTAGNSSSNGSGSRRRRRALNLTMQPTDEYCGAGHQLGRVCSLARKRYLQQRDGLNFVPTIECDCCGKTISNENIAGCCLHCDIDFCQACFQSGQSFEDALKDSGINNDDDDNVGHDDDNRDDYRNENQHQEELVASGFGNGGGGGARYSRYNGHRPTYQGTGRVNYDEYPDPTAFQWTFTGSCEDYAIEFFEKDFARLGVIRLDFYYTRGEAKTVLKHPTKGEKKLFVGRGMKLSPTLYRKILIDPRTHTDKRIHNKKKKKKQLV